MNLGTTRIDGAAIVYDTDTVGQIDPSYFDPAFWRDRGALLGSARGRGSVWIVRDGRRELVLRHYLRGGLLGPWLGDRYLWLGLLRTRALREWHMLWQLHALGLPAPRPVAAQVRRAGPYYRADLVTERIPEGATLAQRLVAAPLPEELWRAVGQCVRRFHEVGICHGDLNAHNVLLAPAGVYLVDFDRSCWWAAGDWQRRNLARLHRSLGKLSRQLERFHFTDHGWTALVAGYEGR